MAQISMTVRMDEQLKKKFDYLCSQFGMSANAAMNIFAKAVVTYRRIPFEIKAPDEPMTSNGLETFYALRAEAKKRGLQYMSLEEINDEIEKSRTERGTSIVAEP